MEVAEVKVLTLNHLVWPVANSTSYQIIAGGVAAQYTSDGSATAAEIATGLAADFDPLVFDAVATDGKIRLTSVDKVSDFPLTVDANLTITLLGSPAVFTAVELVS